MLPGWKRDRTALVSLDDVHQHLDADGEERVCASSSAARRGWERSIFMRVSGLGVRGTAQACSVGSR